MGYTTASVTSVFYALFCFVYFACVCVCSSPACTLTALRFDLSVLICYSNEESDSVLTFFFPIIIRCHLDRSYFNERK